MLTETEYEGNGQTNRRTGVLIWILVRQDGSEVVVLSTPG